MSNSNSTTYDNGNMPVLAVLDVDAQLLHVSTDVAAPRAVGTAGSLARWCEACGRRGIAQLWIVGRGGAPGNGFDYAAADGWDMQPAGQAAAPWIHAVKAHSPYQVDVVFPALMVESRDSRSECWHDAGTDAAALLSALLLFRSLVGGQTWHRSSGATAARLLRRLHTGPRRLPLELPYAHVEDWPAPAQDRRVEGPIAWYRPLTAREMGAGWYLHRYDKNGAFLGALGQVRWGSGQARHEMGAPAMEDTHGAGYALIDVPRDSGRIPAIAHDRKPGSGAVWRGWVTMPTLRFMQERGERLTVHEHYTWAQSHKPAEGMYKLLGGARATLLGMGDGDAVAALALRAVKGVYSSFTGGYMASVRWERDGDTLYRPDVRHAIMGTARVNLVRRAEWVYAQDGIAPVAIGNVDTIYYALPDRWPLRAAAAHIPALRLGTTLRDFKPAGTTPITDDLRALLASGDPAPVVLSHLSQAMASAAEAEAEGEGENDNG